MISMVIIILTPELNSKVTTHGFTNSQWRLCHQLMDIEAQVPVKRVDGIHLTSIQTHQHMDLMDQILPVVRSLQEALFNTNITIIIKLWLKILETRELLKRYNNLQQTIRVFSHSLGEESRRLTQSMDSRTHHSNGLIQNQD